MKVILTCGGTGGHIYPAIAIADKIKEKHPEAEILFIGTKKGMENNLVPAAGYNIKGIDASGFSRKSIKANVATLHNLRVGGRDAEKIIKDFKPDLAIGTGGYVTGSVLLHAHHLGVPCCVHEQNAIPGMANKLISEFADKVFISFENTLSGFRHPKRVVYTGNPIRSDFTKLDRKACREELGIKDDEIMILATGGSLGAAKLNEEIIKFAKKISLPEIKLFFVTGKRYYDQIEKECPKDHVTLIDYANNMPVLMTAADLVVSRSGAIAVSEITASGKPSVLVPSPNVTNNHQYHNAKAIADEGAAVLVEEKNFSEEESVLADEILSLLASPESLISMAEHAKRIGKTDAADIIYTELTKWLK